MFARLEDEDGRSLTRASVGDGVALLEVPFGERAFDGGVPSAEAKFGDSVWGRGLVGEGVVEEACAALDVCVGLDGELEELDGVGESGGQIEFCGGGHGRILQVFG